MKTINRRNIQYALTFKFSSSSSQFPILLLCFLRNLKYGIFVFANLAKEIGTSQTQC
jgi:hypothetical protein